MQLISDVSVTHVIAYGILALLSCYLGGFGAWLDVLLAEKKTHGRKLHDQKNYFTLEAESMFSSRRSRISRWSAISLLLLLVVSLVSFFSFMAGMVLLLALLFSTLLLHRIVAIGLIRYLIEIPKLAFLYAAFGAILPFSHIMFIIAIGSLFYALTPRGLVLLELFLFGYNALVLQVPLLVNLALIISLRLIGVVFFALPLFLLKLRGRRDNSHLAYLHAHLHAHLQNQKRPRIPRQKLEFHNISAQAAAKASRFTTDLRAFFGTDITPAAKIVHFSSGRDSLYAILSALRKSMPSGTARIAMASYNFSLIPEVAQAAGFDVVYVDVDPKTYTIDVSKLKRILAANPISVVLATHMFGNPCDMDALLALKKKYGFVLVEDCAHTLGARYHGKLCGTFAEASLFSLHPSKPLHGLYGGFALINTEDMQLTEPRAKPSFSLETMLLIKNNIQALLLDAFFPALFSFLTTFHPKGLSRKAQENLLDAVSVDAASFIPKQSRPGMLNMSIAEVNLQQIHARNLRRRKIKDWYQHELSGDCKLQQEHSMSVSYPLLLPISIDGLDQNGLRQLRILLQRRGIDTKYEYMVNISGDRSSQTQKLADTLLFLPLFYDITRTEIHVIAHHLERALAAVQAKYQINHQT